MVAIALLLFLSLGVGLHALAQIYQELHVFQGSYVYGAYVGDGGLPDGALIQGTDGCFYGTTYYGGTYCDPTNNPDGYGTVFKMTPDGAVTILASFNGTNGAYPSGALLQASDGNLYGTTENGGRGYGTLFRITTNGVLTMLNAFYEESSGDYTHGTDPTGSLVEGLDGELYGTCQDGGATAGTIFKMPLNGGPLTNFYVFDPNQPGTGGNPSGGLILGRDGKFYGVTPEGGPSAQYGTVYSITSNGVLTVLASFSGSYPRWPYDRLLQASDGNFYGVSAESMFSVTPSGIVTPLVNGDAGENLNGGLIEGNDGNFYGTAGDGGSYCCPASDGTVFEMTPEGLITTMFSFTDNSSPCPGQHPYASLVQGNDCNLYGTCGFGAGGFGNIFRIVMPGPLLSSSQAGSKLVLSWRTNYVGFTLRSCFNPISVNWTNCSNAPAVVGGQFVVTNPISSGSQFFRLKK